MSIRTPQKYEVTVDGRPVFLFGVDEQLARSFTDKNKESRSEMAQMIGEQVMATAVNIFLQAPGSSSKKEQKV